MADFDLVVTGNLVLAERIVADGFVAVAGGKIALTGEGPPPAARETFDARGFWVLPGVIDGQVHAGSQANQEGLGHASRAAAAGGVTTMVDMPYDDPEPVWHGELLRNKIQEVERDCHVDAALYATISEAHGTSTIAGLIEAGACAFKFSTFEAAPGRFPRIDEDVLYEAFALIAPARSRLRRAQSDAGADAQERRAAHRGRGHRLGRVRPRPHAADRAPRHRAGLRARRAHRGAGACGACLPVAGLRALRELQGVRPQDQHRDLRAVPDAERGGRHAAPRRQVEALPAGASAVGGGALCGRISRRVIAPLCPPTTCPGGSSASPIRISSRIPRAAPDSRRCCRRSGPDARSAASPRPWS